MIKVYYLEKIKYIFGIGGNFVEIERSSNLSFLPTCKNKYNNLKEYFLVGVSYIFLTAILTYPVLFKIKTDIPGTGVDSFQWMRILFRYY